jgi:hypothetical protein
MGRDARDVCRHRRCEKRPANEREVASQDQSDSGANIGRGLGSRALVGRCFMAPSYSAKISCPM